MRFMCSSLTVACKLLHTSQGRKAAPHRDQICHHRFASGIASWGHLLTPVPSHHPPAAIVQPAKHPHCPLPLRSTQAPVMQQTASCDYIGRVRSKEFTCCATRACWSHICACTPNEMLRTPEIKDVALTPRGWLPTGCHA